MSKLTNTLVKSLRKSSNEKDVEHAYWHAFHTLYPNAIGSDDKTDGLLECDDITALLEFKFQCNMRNKLEVATVILQGLFYLKRMEKSGKVLPKSLFIGDADECFCVNVVPPIAKYLVTTEIDWSTAPSKAGSMYPAIVGRIAEDMDINPFVYCIDDKFNFEDVVEKLKALEHGTGYSITITQANVIEIFKYFTTVVVTDKKWNVNTGSEESNVKATMKLADVFMNCLTDKETTYLHPRKKNVLVSRGEDIKVDSNLFKAFFGHFKQEYTPQELEVVVGNKDRILDELHRRRTGAFFTPPIWVAEAHKMLGESLGEGWKEEYVVWDCACGVGNLTRDTTFKELYLSTLEEGDVNTIKDMGFNKGCTLFQYDFLGEVGIDGVPGDLKRAFADGRKVLFLINPPYGRAGAQGLVGTSGLSSSAVGNEMTGSKIGPCSANLYAQFLYKVMQLKEQGCAVSLGVFCPPLFLNGESFKQFLKKWFTHWRFSDGMLLQASNFADVDSQWGISFTIWS